MTINTDHCQEHYNEVLQVAKASGQAQKLDVALRSLQAAVEANEVVECRLFKYSMTPLSFIVHIHMTDQNVLTGVLLWEHTEEAGYDWRLHLQHERGQGKT